MIVKAAGFKWQVDDSYPPSDLMGPNHEQTIEHLILSQIPPGGVFLDVGAHVGHYTLRASQFCEKIIAVEAMPETAERLKANLGLNNISNVTIFNVAAWDAHTTLGSESPNSQPRDGSMRVIEQPEGGRVTAAPLDDLLHGEPQIDFVKLDVEGADLHALNGMKETLHRLRPRMVVEDHSIYGYYSRPALDALLNTLDYDISHLGDYGNAPYILATPR